MTEQELFRFKKVEELKELGVNPFGERFDRTHLSKQIHDEFSKYTKEELEQINKTVIVAGRIVLKRVQGKAGFITLQDRDGRIQIYVRFNDVGEFSLTCLNIVI